MIAAFVWCIVNNQERVQNYLSVSYAVEDDSNCEVCVDQILQSSVRPWSDHESYWQKQCFTVVLFLMLFNVVQTVILSPWDHILRIDNSNKSLNSSGNLPNTEITESFDKCNHLYESYWEVLSCGAVYYAAQYNSNAWVCGWNPKLWLFTSESYWAVLCGGAVYSYDSIQCDSNFPILWTKS